MSVISSGNVMNAAQQNVNDESKRPSVHSQIAWEKATMATWLLYIPLDELLYRYAPWPLDWLILRNFDCFNQSSTCSSCMAMTAGLIAAINTTPISIDNKRIVHNAMSKSSFLKICPSFSRTASQEEEPHAGHETNKECNRANPTQDVAARDVAHSKQKPCP